MPSDEPALPAPTGDERESLLGWLGYLRGAVVRKAQGLDEEAAHRRPGASIAVVGVVRHLTQVEWRWTDGAVLGRPVSRHEGEFAPGPELTLAAALEAYRARWGATDALVRSLALETRCDDDRVDLRWVVMHLINETARHAGHADVTRELIDGTVGE